MSDSNDYSMSSYNRFVVKKRRKRSLRNIQSPTSPLKLKIKLGSPSKSPSSSHFESPYTSDSDSLPPSDLDTDSSGSYPAPSLEVTIPRYIYDMCQEDVDVSTDDRLDIESPSASPHNQLRIRQTQTGGLTVRQRALAGIADSELMELPYYDKPKELTEEMRAKKAEVALQRRIQNQRQQEINKRETIKRLLTRQTHAKKKDDDRKLSRYNPNLSYVTYLSNKDGITLTYPSSVDVDLHPRISTDKHREISNCAVPVCNTQ